MSTADERRWSEIRANIRADAIPALVNVLARWGDLRDHHDQLLALAADELRADQVPGGRNLNGKLGQAIALIEAGAAKPTVLAAGISRRTYFRALRECQQCQVTPSHSSV